MFNQSGKTVLILLFILLIAGVALYFFSHNLKQSSTGDTAKQSNSIDKNVINGKAIKKYISEDLKISFLYPKGWFVDEKHYSILLTSFPTRIGKNDQPTKEQIRIDIDNYGGGCHSSTDENLKDPACGEGGSKVKPNEILSKEVENINGAKFYKYLLKYPSGEEKKFYFLEKEDRILQIAKNPDPSQFEEEFDQIVQSFEFKP